MKKYFHELSDEEINKLIEDKTLIKDIMENYLQPSWCGYPDALAGKMGCWSLMSEDTRKSISRKFCYMCDCYSKDYIQLSLFPNER